MRCILKVLVGFVLLHSSIAVAEEKLSLYMQNKRAIEKTVKMYVAFEARYEIGPGVDADLKLPEKAQFRAKRGDLRKWVYPVALGLEIKIGPEQRRVLVLAPRTSGGKYLVATDDLVVKAYTKKELAPVFQAIERRRKKLAKGPSD